MFDRGIEAQFPLFTVCILEQLMRPCNAGLDTFSDHCNLHSSSRQTKTLAKHSNNQRYLTFQLYHIYQTGLTLHRSVELLGQLYFHCYLYAIRQKLFSGGHNVLLIHNNIT